LFEFFSFKGFLKATGEQEDAGVEDCIPRTTFFNITTLGKRRNKASEQKLMEGGDSVTPGYSPSDKQ
jgi:hypothetical protein